MVFFMRPFRFVRAALGASLAMSAVSLALAAKPKPIAFQVKAQPMAFALMSLARQAQIEVLFSYDDLKGLEAPALSGKYTTEQALSLLLRGTPYLAQQQKAKSFQILTGDQLARTGTPLPGSVAAAEAARVAKARGEKVTQLDNVIVLSKKTDVERTSPPLPVGQASIEPAQTPDGAVPYVIFEGKQIEQSGAATVSEFLSERLPASTGTNLAGEIGVRTLGPGSTKSLLNGRELLDNAGFPSLTAGLSYQMSGYARLPLSSVDRIEVLPQAASGYFGGGATGGAVNVVTKRDYSGGELTLGYDNSFDTDSANRRAELRYGTSFFEGRTRFMLFAGANDSHALTVMDRYDLVRDYAARATTGSAGLLGGTIVPLGTTPRIDSADGNALVLKSGQTLSSSFVYLPAGFRSVEEDGTAGLVANAGKVDTSLPDTAQAYLGRRLSLHRRPSIDSLRAEFRQRVTGPLEAYVEFSYEKAFRKENAALFSSDTYLTVPVGVPTNPFGQTVRIRYPYQATGPHESSRWQRGLTGGFLLDLPRDWQVRLEQTRTYQRANERAVTADLTNLATAVNAGTVNVFQDSLANPDFLAGYTTVRTGRGSIESVDSVMKAEGELPSFWSIQPSLALSTRFRKVGRETFEVYDDAANRVSGVLPSSHSVGSFQGEVTLPLISAEHARPGLRALEVNVAGRRDKYELNSTFVKATGLQSVDNLKSLPVLGSATARYTSSNPVYAIRYKPVDDVALRASYSTGFTPISELQLLPQFSAQGTVSDPQRGQADREVEIVTGGNAMLKPEDAKSVSTGVIYTPKPVPGLRLSVDYTSLRKENTPDILSAQTILAFENQLPGRVTREAPVDGDTFTVGQITKVDASALNLYSARLESWDVSLGYQKEFVGWGTFDFSTLYTLQSKYEQQLTPGGPRVDLVDEPLYAGPLRDRAVASLVWSRRQWGAGWSVRYHSRYRASALSSSTVVTEVPAALGSSLAAQTYHDAFVRYRFAKDRHGWSGLLGGTELLMGVRNLFNADPLFDATVPSDLLLSRYSDLRMASYYFSLKREF